MPNTRDDRRASGRISQVSAPSRMMRKTKRQRQPDLARALAPAPPARRETSTEMKIDVVDAEHDLERASA